MQPTVHPHDMGNSAKIFITVKNTDLLHCIFWQKLTDVCILYDEDGGTTFIPNITKFAKCDIASLLTR